MSIIVKNGQLSNETISVLNKLIDFDLNADIAFKLTRIIKELSSIVDDKLKIERKILEKYSEKDENGNIKPVMDNDGNLIEGAVNILNMDGFSLEMSKLMEITNEINQDKVNFNELGLQSAKIKDLILLDFLFK